MKSYATLTQLKDKGYLDLESNTDYDTTLLRMLESASEDIDHMCYRHFDCIEGTIYCDGSGRTLIPAEDILSITSMKLDMDGSRQWATDCPTTDYFLYPINGNSLYPKTYLRMALNSTCGTFAPGILSGVKITGVFGHGDGNSATPYKDSGISITVATTTGTTLTLSAEGTLQPGHTIRVESEQIYIQAVSSNGTKTATVDRAVNGTTGAVHSTAKAYIYQYPGPITESVLLLATNWWKQRENPTVFRSGNSITGEYEITTDIEKIMTKRLNHHIKRKLL